jgi:hypothetical protein
MQLFQFRKDKGTKKGEKRLYLYAGIVRKITWLKELGGLTVAQAIADGFETKDDAIALLCKINNSTQRNAAIITQFKPVNLPFKRRQSIVFTHLLDELLRREKRTTIRMLNIPKYWESKVINIVFKFNPNLEKHLYGNSIEEIYEYAKKNTLNDPFYNTHINGG